MLTRFAPSPTGLLHIGNVRTALLCYLYAKKSGGKFLLRIDDTDTERSRDEYIDAIKRELSWLGIEWDIYARQSERFDIYAKAVEKLKSDGALYACYETTKELEIKRKMQLSRGLPPIYDRAGERLTKSQKNAYENEGRKPHYRFLLKDRDISWNDEIRGETTFKAKNLSDPILIRENGIYTYMLPSTVDDIDLGITHILRGEDHVSNTAIQIELFDALGGKIPVFAHNALIKTKDGKLSKRTGGSNVASLRESGIEPMAVNSFLAKVGTSDSIELRKKMHNLVDEFDINKFSRASVIYSLDDIKRLNEKLLHHLSFDEIKSKLDIGEKLWLVIRENISSLDEIILWKNVCEGNIEHVIEDEDVEFMQIASELLPQGTWNEDTWGEWILDIKEKTGRKGKSLFMPLRKAITGLDSGPELKMLLPMIGYENVKKRLCE